MGFFCNLFDFITTGGKEIHLRQKKEEGVSPWVFALSFCVENKWFELKVGNMFSIFDDVFECCGLNARGEFLEVFVHEPHQFSLAHAISEFVQQKQA